MTAQGRRFLTDFHIRAPLNLVEAVARAADKRLTSRSDYIRGALLDRLRADDIALTAQPNSDTA